MGIGAKKYLYIYILFNNIFRHTSTLPRKAPLAHVYLLLIIPSVPGSFMSVVELRVELPSYSHSFIIQVPPTYTIAEVKGEITKTCVGAPRADGQRIIWRGRVLRDDEKVNEIWKVNCRLRSLPSSALSCGRLSFTVDWRFENCTSCCEPFSLVFYAPRATVNCRPRRNRAIRSLRLVY